MTVSFKNGEQLGYTEDSRTSDWPNAIACNILSTLETEFKLSNTFGLKIEYGFRSEEAQGTNDCDPRGIQLQS